MIMALDNPSYFTIPGGATSSAGNRSGRFSLIRKHVRMGGGSSLASARNISSDKSKKGERYSILPTNSNAASGSGNPFPGEIPPEEIGGCLRRSFRSLLLQSNSLDNPIQTQMFVLGMPRPSDIAPAVHQASPSCRKQNGRSANAGNKCRFPGNKSPKRTDVSGQECLPASGEDRYYNGLPGTSLILQNGRRHSIGAYFNRKSATSSRNPSQIEEETSFSNDSSMVDFKFAEDPTIERKPEVEGSDLRKKKKDCCCCCCQNPKGGKIGMEDIVIVSSKRSQAADLWVTYLKTCFDQIRKNRNKPPFRILGVEIEDFEEAEQHHSSVSLDEKLKNAKLVIFIICPVFLEHVSQIPEICRSFCRQIRPDAVLAMLLGIGEGTITSSHKSALANYSQWKRMESVKDRDEKFVGDFLGTAMDIISKNITQNNQPITEKGSFRLMPKKVNKSQNKVLILLNDPISKEDAIKVTLIRNNEVFEIPSVKKRNPYTLLFRMPEEFLAVSLLVTIRVERNGIDLGAKLLKCESQLYATAQILKNCDGPLEFMCQALNIVPCDKDKLDEFLMMSFQRNVPPNFNLLQTTGLGQLHRGVTSQEEYPTLLHFAARFGLEKLCWVLLECPGGELACEIRNVCELIPSEMAENAGHTKLANALCGYMQMTEFTSVYTFLKGMSDEKNCNSKSDSSDDYLNPRPLSETYQVPPSPRPLAPKYCHPPFGYMQMQSPKSSLSSSVSDSHDSGRHFCSSKERLLYRKNSDESLRKIDSDQNSFKSLREGSGNGIQDELIEIINDFKNNVFTISEVEKLVEDWRNRNDVQQSFKEKQEQLNKMREEYEQVQQKLKEEMKSVGRISPMERIKNFFRSKTKDSAKSRDGQDGKKKSRQIENLLIHRPSSGLSMQSCSSSSSGRLSTGSHCSGTSLGDSGTHSDAESERKIRSTPTFCNSFKVKGGIENYDVPPPNPVCLISNPAKSQIGISNYDIPPSCLSIEADPKHQRQQEQQQQQQHWDRRESLLISCDSRNGEANYYNLTAEDAPVPNQSTLHGSLAKSIKNNLKTVQETTEIRSEENNCYEYINLPVGINGDKEENGEIDGEDAVSETNHAEIQVPDYVNVENGVK